jgi:hypothetical protein
MLEELLSGILVGPLSPRGLAPPVLAVVDALPPPPPLERAVVGAWATLLVPGLAIDGE